jgi:hypothetical protein
MEPVIDVLDALGLKYAFGFVVFFAASAVAVYYHDRPRVRQGWTVLFVVMLFVPLIVGSNWPFLAWALYDEPGPTNVTHHPTFLVESDGDLVRLDMRAFGHGTEAVFRGYATKMSNEWNETTVRRLGTYLVAESNEHRSRLRGNYDFGPEFWVPNGLRFPRHQLDYRWDQSVVTGNDTFVAVVVYRVDANISVDGSSIEEVTCTPATVVELSRAELDRQWRPPQRAPFPVCQT